MAYAASKGALAVATQGLARELGRYGVRVNGIHPSYIWGKSVEWYVNDMADQARRRLPGGVRRAGRPDLPQVPALIGRDRRRGGVLRLAAGQGRDRPEPQRELRRVPLVTDAARRGRLRMVKLVCFLKRKEGLTLERVLRPLARTPRAAHPLDARAGPPRGALRAAPPGARAVVGGTPGYDGITDPVVRRRSTSSSAFPPSRRTPS